jgi:8-hydroxy-5-deazaflavin:NADPH oxidoreductase
MMPAYFRLRPICYTQAVRLKQGRPPSPSRKPFAASTSSLSPFLRRIFQTLPARLFAETPDRVVVVDTANYYPRQRDSRIEAIEAGLPESKWVAQQLGRPVIKTFNNIYAKHLLGLGRPKGTPGRIALPVSGDDDAAKSIVLKLIDELGFDAVDAGGLNESWRQQPGTPVYAEDFDADGVRGALAKAKDRTAEWRATNNSPSSFTAPA